MKMECRAEVKKELDSRKVRIDGSAIQDSLRLFKYHWWDVVSYD